MPVFTKVLQKNLQAKLLDQPHEIMANINVGSLGEILTRNFPSLSRPLLIDCVQEQGEDIYWVLVSSKEIAVIEIPRGKAEAFGSILEIIDVDTYRFERLSRDPRQRLAMALDLIS
jgi:hypothetical protein